MDSVTVYEILNYLSSLYDKGNSYSHIKATKAAIGHMILLPPYSKIGDHPLIKKFMSGVFNLRPPRQKSAFVWDVKILFDHFDSLPDNTSLSDEVLSQKLVILLLILGGQRVNTIFWFRTDEMIINDISILFAPSHVLKHSRKNKKLNTFEYRSYPHNSKLCVVNCLKNYLDRRDKKVSPNIKKLLITYKKPYKEVSTDTIRR